MQSEAEIYSGLVWDAENEEAYARADARWSAQQEWLKAVKATALPHQGTVQEREQVMYRSAEFRDAMELYEQARFEYRAFVLKYKRHEAERSIYQTMCANRRKV